MLKYIYRVGELRDNTILSKTGNIGIIIIFLRSKKMIISIVGSAFDVRDIFGVASI